MRLTNFEFGSVKVAKDQVSIQIPKSHFKYDSLNELNDIKSDRINFLSVLDIQENEKSNRVEFYYEIPKGLIPFYKIKNEDLIVKLSILKQIVEDDVLSSNQFVSIHPSTLFYRPMKTVKYTYLANDLMPSDNKYSNIDRYKALVISVLSGLSYEICLNNKDKVSKKKNELIESIIEVKSREELLSDLESLLEYKQYYHFKTNKENQSKKKIRRIAIVAVSFLVLILAIGLTKSMANKEHVQTVAYYEQEIENVKEENELKQHLANEDYEKAAESMRKIGEDEEAIAKMFLDAGLYQQALDTEPDYLNDVIKILYENDKKDEILDLKIEDNEQLETEKQIVSYDYAELKAKQHFIENEDTVIRLGKAFADNGNMEDAQLLQEKVKNDELGNYITLKQKNSELKTNKDKLATLEKELKKEKKKSKKKDKKNQIKTTKEKIESLEKEIEELQKK